MSLAHFLRIQGADRAVQEALRQSGRYRLRDHCYKSPETDDIFSCIKQGMRAYIPGSEIKGAVRTAIIRYLMDTDEFRPVWNRLLSEIESLRRRHSAALNQASQALKDRKSATQQIRNGGYRHFQKLLRLPGLPSLDARLLRDVLHRRDKEEKSEADIRAGAMRILKLKSTECDLLVREIRAWRAQKSTLRTALGRAKLQYTTSLSGIRDRLIQDIHSVELECVKAILRQGEHDLMRFIRVGDTQASDNLTVSECVVVDKNKGPIPIAPYHEGIGADTRFEASFDLGGEAFHLDLLGFGDGGEQRKLLDIKGLFECIHQASKSILLEERWFFRNARDPGYVRDDIEYLMEQNQSDSPLLRIGKAQGFLSLTLGTLIKHYDQQNGTSLYTDLLVVIQSDKNNPTADFPVTRRLLRGGDGKYHLPGWVKLYAEGVSSSAPGAVRTRQPAQPERTDRPPSRPPSVDRPTQDRQEDRQADQARRDLERLRKEREAKSSRQASVRPGQKVQAEVLENDGRSTVIVRLVDTGQEFKIQPWFPAKKGSTIKVTIQDVDTSSGRITKVRR